MKRLRIWVSVIVVLAFAVLIGCGGGSSDGINGTNSQLKITTQSEIKENNIPSDKTFIATGSNTILTIPANSINSSYDLEINRINTAYLDSATLNYLKSSFGFDSNVEFFSPIMNYNISKVNNITNVFRASLHIDSDGFLLKNVGNILLKTDKTITDWTNKQYYLAYNNDKNTKWSYMPLNKEYFNNNFNQLNFNINKIAKYYVIIAIGIEFNNTSNTDIIKNIDIYAEPNTIIASDSGKFNEDMKLYVSLEYSGNNPFEYSFPSIELLSFTPFDFGNSVKSNIQKDYYSYEYKSFISPESNINGVATFTLILSTKNKDYDSNKFPENMFATAKFKSKSNKEYRSEPIKISFSKTSNTENDGSSSQDNIEFQSRTVRIDSQGRLPTITFPSGARIEASEKNTLQPGIKVTITEQKQNIQNTSYFDNSELLYTYIITAYLDSSSILGNKTSVTSLEKPLRVTLPSSDNTNGKGFIGIKESENDPWRFCSVDDGSTFAQEVSFNIYRLGTQFALVTFEGNTDNRLPEAYVTSFDTDAIPSIQVKDGKYQEDLKIEGIIKGVKLDSINPSDLRARITYRNNWAEEAPIKVNGINVAQTSKSDKTIPGYTYSHSFIVDSINESNLMSTNGDFTFKLNLNGVETQLFPSGFLIEFYNKVDSEKVLPYYYSEFFTVNLKELVNNAFTIKYNLDGGTVTQPNPTNYGEASETFTLIKPVKDGYSFIGWTGSNGNIPQITVSIASGSTGDKEFLANYTPISYSIVYNLNDGLLSAANPEKYDITSSTITLNNPTKEGYTFIGWSGTDLTGDNNLTVTIPCCSKGDREYTANWSKNSYSLSLNLGTGIASVEGEGIYEYGSTVTASCTMLDGYEFDSWTGDLTTATFTMPACNATMTANAKPINYNIVYNLNGGNMPDGIYNPINYDVTSATITINNPTKAQATIDGYTVFYLFDGWTGTGADTATTTINILQGSTGNREYTANWIALEMRPITAGTFMMGCPSDELGQSYDNRPQHSVTISQNFYIGKYEVTQEQYFAIMGTNPSYFGGNAYNPIRPTTTVKHPVEDVSWDDIASASECFLVKINDQLADQIPAGYRFDLPTEAQWEYACRAGTTTSLNNNTNITVASGTCPNLSVVGWYKAISEDKTHEVGSKVPNAWGLYDMHGNVWEWCKDWYGNYSSDNITDPVGTASGTYRVMRGGSWYDNPQYCRSAGNRITYDPIYGGYVKPTDKRNFLGFRLVLVPTD